MLKRFIFSYINEWSQIRLRGFNWYTFTPIHLSFEYDKMTEGLEFEFFLFGLGFRIRYNLPASDAIFAKWEKEAKIALKKIVKKKKKI